MGGSRSRQFNSATKAQPPRHAKRRLKERFGITMGRQTRRQIHKAIREGTARRLGDEGTRGVYLLRLQGRFVILVYDDRTSFPVTALEQFRGRTPAQWAGLRDQ